MHGLIGVLVIATTLGSSTVGAVAAPPSARLAHLAVPSLQGEQGPPEGIALELLASQDLLASWPDSESVTVVLERVPLDPGDALDGRDSYESGGGYGPGGQPQAAGMHLLYVETGQIAVATADGEATYRQGESAVMSGVTMAAGSMVKSAPPYELRNDSADCASVLRLSVWFRPPGIGSVPSAPRGPERGCGEYELLLQDFSTFPWPEPPPDWFPVRLFVARLHWDEEAWLSSESFAYPGPVGLLVESGQFDFVPGEEVSAGAIFAAEARVSLPSGGKLYLKNGASVQGSGIAGTTAIIAGVAPTEQDRLVLPPRPGTGAALAMPGAFAPGARVTTRDEGVRLRALPTTESPIVAELPEGSELTVTGPPERFAGDTIDWYPVTDTQGRLGYVAGMFIASIPE